MSTERPGRARRRDEAPRRRPRRSREAAAACSAFWRSYGLAVAVHPAPGRLGAHRPRRTSRSTCCPRPRRSRSPQDDWSTSSGPAMWVTLREVLIGFVIAAVAGRRAGGRAAPVRAAAPGHVPAPDRLADDPDRRAGADPGHPARLRDPAEARHRRADLLLPDRGERHRRSAVGRRRLHPHDAHARRDALGHLPARRVPGRAAVLLLRACGSRRRSPRSGRSSASGRARAPASVT